MCVMTGLLLPDELQATFALMDGWEERYEYLVDLGRALPPMDPALKTDDILVHGCTSRVWLMAQGAAGADGMVHYDFTADSDAAIVKGLVAVVLSCVQGRSGPEIAAFDIGEFFRGLGLEEHLTPNRRSGFYAMVTRVKQLVG